MAWHARILFVLLSVFLVFSFLVACAENDSSDDDDQQASDDDNDAAADDDNQSDDDSGSGDRLQAGAASGYLQVPIGISLGGFAARVGFQSPYNQLMGGSIGYYDRPSVKAVSLQSGDRRLVIAKVAMMGVTESLRTQVVNQVKATTGVDLDRTLILTATHTHSGPARFFFVPDIFGLVGVDAYNQEMVDRIAGSIAAIIEQAIAAQKPARIGFGYREPFDPQSLVTRDRRCANGPGDFREDRLWVGRIEDEEGEPMAMLIGMAMHGVVYGYGSFYLTGDAPEGVERAVEKLYDHPVTAIYLQGSSGDVVSQMGSPLGHRRAQIVEWIGAEVAEVVDQVQREIVTDDQPELKVITQRYRYDRQELGYLPGEFGFYNRDGEFVEYQRGAMECATLPMDQHGSINDCDTPETKMVDGYLGCLLNLDWSIADDAVNYLQQSPITVAQIGDQLFFTAPGEITSHLAVDIRTSLAAQLGIPYENINTLGYSQNYIFYILQDWDWWQGGGEMQGTLFGWRFGPWLQKTVGNLAGRLAADDLVVQGDPQPSLYHEALAPVAPEASERLGEINVQPEADQYRFNTVRFSWYGGHPGVDFLTVTLQQQIDGQWRDVRRANGTVYDDKGWEMAVRLFPAPSYKEEKHRDSREFQYLVEWETMWDDPTGPLRFKVDGRAKGAGGIKAYQLFSSAFMMHPTYTVELTDLSATVVDSDLVISLEAAYPHDPIGTRRIRSVLAGGSHPAIVSGGEATALVSVNGAAEVPVVLTYNRQQHRLVGMLAGVAARATVTVRVTAGAFDDGYGNLNAEELGPVAASR
ncbi:MAG: hypothetical protein GX444_00810 [Myxococcales bacterium]|nr:hypothetical protein [Myxococcales bacterium]